MRYANARLIDSRRVDIDVDTNSGLITAITGSGTTAALGERFDLDGLLTVSAFVEPHTHLDKALLSERVDNPQNDLLGAIRAIEESRASITYEDIVERATRVATMFAQNGVGLLRTHADTMSENGLQSIKALLEVKARCADFIDIQVAMLLAWPVVGVAGARHRELAEEAIAVGVDVVGGCPHLEDQPEPALEYFLELAERHSLPLDLHADENLRATSRDLEHLADRMLSLRPRVSANASHCVSLGVQPVEDQRRTAEKVAEAGITVTALPITNLFLQARDCAVGPPRGLTAIAALREADVVVAAGADNVQDPFNPMGRADPLETAALMVVAGHVDPTFAFASVGPHGRVALGHGPTQPAGIPAVGEDANFVSLPASTLRDAIANQPRDRVVIHRGRHVYGRVRNTK